MIFTDDGLGRPMRPIQREVLDWVGANWASNKHLFAGLGVGAGKSSIIRAVQRKVGGNILTSQNILIGQYKDDYPQLNDLKGGAHYPCAEYGTTCNIGSTRYNCKGGVDSCCQYQNNREAFVEGTPSILNLMSFYLNATRFQTKPGIMLIDEAHTIPGLIRTITSTSVKFGMLEKGVLTKLKFKKEDLVSEIKLCQFLRAKIDRLQVLMQKEKDVEKIEGYYRQIENTSYALQGFESSPEQYVVQMIEGSLKVFPLKAPRKFMDRIIGTGGILTSATLLPHDMRELYGRDDYTFKDFGTPIPAANRQLVHVPMPFGFGYNEIQPAGIAEKIMEIYKSNKTPTVVHCTYSMSERLREHLYDPAIIWHTKEDKGLAVERFKAEGGILIACGLSEGLDLKQDLCRQQIIVQLSFPNISDPFIKKRRALADGGEWYMGETFKTLAQALGRSTRGADDYSTTYILDSRFPQTFQSWKRRGIISKDFEDSVVFMKTRQKA